MAESRTRSPRRKKPETRTESEEPKYQRFHPRTPEEWESNNISLAMEVAEEQMRNRTASSQVIVHYLKLGAMKERLEIEKMQHEIELMRAKTEAIEASKETEELYRNAIKAMGLYTGHKDASAVDPMEDSDDYYD